MKEFNADGTIKKPARTPGVERMGLTTEREEVDTAMAMGLTSEEINRSFSESINYANPLSEEVGTGTPNASQWSNEMITEGTSKFDKDGAEDPEKSGDEKELYAAQQEKNEEITQELLKNMNVQLIENNRLQVKIASAALDSAETNAKIALNSSV